MRPSQFLDSLLADGRYTFTRTEAAQTLPLPPIALKNALWRLSRDGRIVSPHRGFFVIVPAEHRVAGSIPASWFIRDLMACLGRPYYVGLLSAAALHGAAHQAPQELQVLTDRALRPIVVGRNRIRFVKKAHLAQTPITGVRTPTGTLRVSTPEATAFDLVRYPLSAGSLSNIIMILGELADRLRSRALLRAAQAERDLAIAQRLGYLLDRLHLEKLAGPLARWVEKQAPRLTPLRPSRPITGAPRDSRWRIAVNENLQMGTPTA
jgi:predicted transcriptional regulator of viral defense system